MAKAKVGIGGRRADGRGFGVEEAEAKVGGGRRADRTEEGANPLKGSFMGGCRLWLGKHTTLIVYKELTFFDY